MYSSNGLSRKIIKGLRLPFLLYFKIIGLKIKITSSFPLTTVFENCKCISIGSHCNFDKGTILRVFNNENIESSIEIGNNFCGNTRLKILCCGKVEIGNDVTCAGDVFITSENHGLNPNTKSYNDNELISSNVKVGNGVWLGEKVIILPGVTIGDKAIIGAGSVVTKDIPSFSIAVGNPAKVIKKWDDKEKKFKKI